MDTPRSPFPDGPEVPPPDEEGGGPSLGDVVEGAEALGAAGEFLGSAAGDAAAGVAEAGGSALEAAGSCLGGCSWMILVVALTGWAAYSFADGPAKPPAGAPASPSYDKVIDPILKKYCAGCHGPRMGRAGYNVTVYDYLFKNKMGKVMLVAGQPDKSPLLTTMERTDAKRMPPKRELLQPTRAEIELIRAWIKAGAKDD